MNERDSRRTTPARFDPFNERRSRDIRNGLAQAFVEALAADEKEIYHRRARELLADELPVQHDAYIRGRLERYDQLMADSGRRRRSRPYAMAVKIWNLGLFFELHEYLEIIWQRTSGEEHRALKGLIKAAGVYIHLENHNDAAARRLAQRARRQMKQHSSPLMFIANLDVLLECLRRPDPDPPRLEYSGDSEPAAENC